MDTHAAQERIRFHLEDNSGLLSRLRPFNAPLDNAQLIELTEAFQAFAHKELAHSYRTLDSAYTLIRYVRRNALDRHSALAESGKLSQEDRDTLEQAVGEWEDSFGEILGALADRERTK